jgi:putative molybdopterin biosynthesis protein
MHSLNQCLSTDEVAAKLGVSKWTIYNWVRGRKIPCIRIGQDLKFDPADLQQWLTAHKQPVQPVN